jgi:hypothetical protein
LRSSFCRTRIGTTIMSKSAWFFMIAAGIYCITTSFISMNELAVPQDGVKEKQQIVSSVHETTDGESDRLIQETAPHPAWCPLAVCQNSHICRPCHRRFLILLTSGRSASTTLTWMLDSLPGIRMSGENYDLIKRMRTLIEETRSKHFKPAAGTNGPFGHNPTFPGSFACVAQTMVEVINPPPANFSKAEEPHMILGFKTIRFQDDIEKWKLPSVVNFVKEVFPCARIVVNLRSNIKEQAASQMKAFHKENKKTTERTYGIELGNEKLRYIAELFGDQAILLDSSEWTKNISSLNQVVEWLGFDKSCLFQELLEMNTKGGFRNGKESLNMDPKCRYLSGG